jgi:hypothetical protein
MEPDRMDETAVGERLLPDRELFAAPDMSMCHCVITDMTLEIEKMNERSGNVYENIRMRSRSQCRLEGTLPLNVCDAPKAQVGQIVPPAPASPFRTSQTRYFGVCANPPGGSSIVLSAGTKRECL